MTGHGDRLARLTRDAYVFTAGNAHTIRRVLAAHPYLLSEETDQRISRMIATARSRGAHEAAPGGAKNY